MNERKPNHLTTSYFPAWSCFSHPGDDGIGSAVRAWQRAVGLAGENTRREARRLTPLGSNFVAASIFSGGDEVQNYGHELSDIFYSNALASSR